MSSMNLCGFIKLIKLTKLIKLIKLIKLSNTSYEKEKIYKSRKHRGSITSHTHFGFKQPWGLLFCQC